jgi:hypothetical protein
MKKRGYVLVSSIFLMLFLATLLGASMMRVDIHSRLASIEQARLQAFYSAEAGIEEALFRARQGAAVNWFNSPNQVTFTNSTNNYTVRVTNITQLSPLLFTVTLESVGTQNNPFPSSGQHRFINRTIQAQITAENPARFFMSTQHDITVPGGTTIDGKLVAENIKFDTSSRDITVNGEICYTGKSENQIKSGSKSLKDKDNNEIKVPDNLTKIDGITFIHLNIERYENLSCSENQGIRYGDDDTERSNEVEIDLDKISYEKIELENISYCTNSVSVDNFNGVIYAGKRDTNGKVIPVNVKVKGTIKRPLLIVATGNIRIIGDIKPGEKVLDDANDNSICSSKLQLGLFAGNDVIVDESVSDNKIEINAFVFANGGRFYAEPGTNNEPRLSDFKFKGAIAARGQSGTSAIDVSSGYSGKRTYDYNTDFANNLSIPQMTYFANINDWQEITK